MKITIITVAVVFSLSFYSSDAQLLVIIDVKLRRIHPNHSPYACCTLYSKNAAAMAHHNIYALIILTSPYQ